MFTRMLEHTMSLFYRMNVVYDGDRAYIDPPYAIPRNLSQLSLINENAARPTDIIFGRLPWEIRRQILNDAFGDMTLHMDVREHFVPRRDSLRRVNHSRASLHGGPQPPGTNVAYFEPLRTRRWRWWGCVCHNIAPPGFEEWLPEMAAADRLVLQLHTDRCAVGGARYCRDWGVLNDDEATPSHTDPEGRTPTGRPSRRCNIGVMGWLLSCKQAYVEGIKVLFSENTIVMSGNVLFPPPGPVPTAFLLPQRMADIYRLAVNLDLAYGEMSDPPAGGALGQVGHRIRKRHEEERLYRDRVKRLFAMLLGSDESRVLPNLRWLWIGFSDWDWTWDWHTPVKPRGLDVILLHPVSKVVQAYPSTEISLSVYEGYLLDAGKRKCLDSWHVPLRAEWKTRAEGEECIHRWWCSVHEDGTFELTGFEGVDDRKCGKGYGPNGWRMPGKGFSVLSTNGHHIHELQGGRLRS